MKTALAVLAATILGATAARAADAEKPTVEKFYASKCASCHGKDGKGNEKLLKMLKTEMKHLDIVDEETLSKKDEELIKEIMEGENKMPAFKAKLGGVSVEELVKYMRALKPAPKK